MRSNSVIKSSDPAAASKLLANFSTGLAGAARFVSVRLKVPGDSTAGTSGWSRGKYEVLRIALMVFHNLSSGYVFDYNCCALLKRGEQ